MTSAYDSEEKARRVGTGKGGIAPAGGTTMQRGGRPEALKPSRALARAEPSEEKPDREAGERCLEASGEVCIDGLTGEPLTCELLRKALGC